MKAFYDFACVVCGIGIVVSIIIALFVPPVGIGLILLNLVCLNSNAKKAEKIEAKQLKKQEQEKAKAMKMEKRKSKSKENNFAAEETKTLYFVMGADGNDSKICIFDTVEKAAMVKNLYSNSMLLKREARYPAYQDIGYFDGCKLEDLASWVKLEPMSLDAKDKTIWGD